MDKEDAFGLRGLKALPVSNLASTQVDIDDVDLLTDLLELQSVVDSKDVIKFENDFHVTVRYGLHEIDPKRLEWIVSQHSSLSVKLGGLSVFENEKQDVLKIDVSSSGLDRINRHLGILPNTLTHSEYKPHLTLAYLKPGTGKKYVGRSGLEGKELTFRSLMYSSEDRRKTELSFNVFCPTGKGGGVDPTCGSGGKGRGLTRSQYTIVKELKSAFDNADTFDLVEGDKYVSVFMTLITPDYKSRLHNTFRVGKRGSLKVVRQEFDSRGRIITNTGIWEFVTTDQKVQEFVRWVKSQMLVAVLGQMATAGISDPEHWVQRHIQDTFARGMGKAFDHVKKPELQKRMDIYQGSKSQFLQDSFFRPVSQQRVNLLAGRAFNELQGMTDKMGTQMQRSITDGFMRGDSPRDIARQLVKDVDNLGKKQARVIARTEIVRAHNEGQLQGLEDLGVEEVGVTVEWSTSEMGMTGLGNPSPCELCAPLAGVVFKINEAKGLLPRHPNCVVGESKIVTPNPLSIMRAKYTGQIVEIVTTEGRRLSVTENHILLTNRGWVRAKELSDSDYLFHAPLINGSVFQSPNDYLSVPGIEDVLTSFVEMFGVGSQCSTDTRSEYFHGDGKSIDGKIDITSFDSILRDDLKRHTFSEFCKSNFMLRDVGVEKTFCLSSQSPLSSFFVATAAAADSFMGFGDISSILFRGSAPDMKGVRFLDVSHPDASFGQCSADEKPVGITHLGNAVGRHPTLVQLDHLIQRLFRNNDFLSAGSKASGSDFDTSLFHFDTKFIGIALKTLSDLSDGHIGGEIEFNSVVQDKIDFTKSRHVTELPVYDVSTQESMYSINGILSSNCMCSWIPAGVGEDSSRQKKTQRQIQSAIASSLKAERPKRKKTDKPSSWAGRAAKIAKKRPRSILEN